MQGKKFNDFLPCLCLGGYREGLFYLITGDFLVENRKLPILSFGKLESFML